MACSTSASASSRRPPPSARATADEMPPPIAPAESICIIMKPGKTSAMPASASVPRRETHQVSISPVDGLRRHHEDVRPGHQQERRDDRALQQAPRARAHRRGRGCRRAAGAAGSGGEVASCAALLRLRLAASERAACARCLRAAVAAVAAASLKSADQTPAGAAIDQHRSATAPVGRRRRVLSPSARNAVAEAAARSARLWKSRPRSVSTYSSRGGRSL